MAGAPVVLLRLVRLLLVAAVLEVVLLAALVGRGGAPDQPDEPYEQFLAAGGLAAAVVLAGAAVLAVRRVRELARQLDVHRGHLAETAEARRRLTSIVHRTERLLGDPAAPEVALQPIVDLATGRWVAVEALARFPGGEPPDRWFADAHEAGVGTTLERRALERAIDLLPRLPAGVELSVNASPALVLDPAFGPLLDRCGDAGTRLVVEITEHESVARYEDIRAALLRHRQRGVRLAVDDTGAGYSSFAHVLRLRPDVIKLDRSLLVDIERDGARRAFVTAIVLMALELGARVTAEGVESAAELDVLATLGVDTVQGFLLARPSCDPAVWARWQDRDWLAHTGAAARGHRVRPLDTTYGGRLPV